MWAWEQGFILKLKALTEDHSCNLSAWDPESGKLLQIKSSVGYVVSPGLIWAAESDPVSKKRVLALEGGLSRQEYVLILHKT